MSQTDIIHLAKKLFEKEEWTAIESYVHTRDPIHTKTLYVDGNLAAFVVVNKDNEGTAFLSYCGVDPEYQGKGYGSKLLKETIDGIFQAGYQTCRLLVDDWNANAKRLYERIGFRQIAIVKQPHVDCFLMELRR